LDPRSDFQRTIQVAHQAARESTTQKLSEVDAEEARATKRQSSPFRIPAVTNLEKMGFVMRGGGSFASDYSRQTADYTRGSFKELEKLNQNVQKLSSNRADFSNQ
jgi:hypothetical protein